MEKEHMTPIQWLKNYWYYYKWYVIAGVFVIIVLAILLTQSLTVEKYDLTVLWTSNTYIDDSKATLLEQELEKYAEDTNGDGKVNVDVILLCFNSSEVVTGNELEFTMQQRLTTQLMAGDAFMVITDEATYQGRLEPLGIFRSDLTALNPDNPSVTDDRFFLKGSVLDTEALSEALGDDFLLVCSDEMQKLVGKDCSAYESALRLFSALTAFPASLESDS